ncbi:MAG: hypothetical protein AAFZ63_15690 [Bacteroidota bacterium]
MVITRLLSIGLLSVLCTLSTVEEVVNAGEKVIFIRECIGVYEYDLTTDETTLLFQIDDDMVVVENPFKRLEHGQLTIGFRLSEFENDSIRFYVGSYGLKGNRMTTTFYEKEKDYQVNVITFDHTSNQMKVDTFYDCKGLSSSWRYLKYNCIEGKKAFERYYSEDYSNKGDRAYSRKGDIYLAVGDSIDQITAFSGEFSPKFGSGFFEPNFVMNDQKIVFRKLGSFWGRQPEELHLYDIASKTSTIIAEGTHSNIKPSTNGEAILYWGGKTSDGLECPEGDIWLLDLTTGEKKKIGVGLDFTWK